MNRTHPPIRRIRRNAAGTFSLGLAVLLPLHSIPSLASDDCGTRQNERAVDDCLGDSAAAADRERERYEAAAMARIAADQDTAEILKDFKAGQAAWSSYRKAECDAVSEHWSDGTARIAQSLTCEIALDHARSHEIWANWLISFGGNPPMLPEPSVK